MAVETVFKKSIIIHSHIQAVWDALIVPEAMQQWMSEFPIEVKTNWEVGQPITITGALYKKPFQNNGTVLAFDKERKLSYTHLSSISRLPDEATSYSVLEFVLEPDGDNTKLSLTISNFPDETIYHHLAFYWNVTLEMLKKFVERK